MQKKTRERLPFLFTLPALIIGILFLIALLFGIGLFVYFKKTASEHYDDRYLHYVTPLCVPEDDTHIRADRITTLDFSEMYVTLQQAANGGEREDIHDLLAVTDAYTLRNPQTRDVTVQVAYPLVYSFDTKGELLVDGDAGENEWWGAYSNMELQEDREDGVIEQRLKDGYYFDLAFPDWPERGQPFGEPYTPPDSPNQSWSYDMAYYVREVTIPGGGEVHVTMRYELSDVSGLSFAPAKDAIACDSRTLVIQNAEGVRFLEQNISEDLSANSAIPLDPARDDYDLSLEYVEPGE